MRRRAALNSGRGDLVSLSFGGQLTLMDPSDDQRLRDWRLDDQTRMLGLRGLKRVRRVLHEPEARSSPRPAGSVSQRRVGPRKIRPRKGPEAPSLSGRR